MPKLTKDFYIRDDVVQISRDLLGKVLCTRLNPDIMSGHGGKITAGKIIETEAYAGAEDKASHAYGNRRTKRTQIMFRQGGVAYVYLCYGIHSLFNVVTNVEDIPDAILIRAIEPLEGIDIMRRRRNLSNILTAGPGTLSKALGIKYTHTGTDLCEDKIWIEDRGIAIAIAQKDIITGTRIGVNYAGKDALLPWRFRVKGKK